MTQGARDADCQPDRSQPTTRSLQDRVVYVEPGVPTGQQVRAKGQSFPEHGTMSAMFLFQVPKLIIEAVGIVQVLSARFALEPPSFSETRSEGMHHLEYRAYLICSKIRPPKHSPFLHRSCMD